MFDLHGIRVIFDRHMTERVQVRFPRTRKKRVRRKWAKRPGNYRERPLKVAYRVEGTILVHPDYFREWCGEHSLEVDGGPGDLLRLRSPAMEARIREAKDRLVFGGPRPEGPLTRPEPGGVSSPSLKGLLEAAKGFTRQKPAFGLFDLPAPTFEVPMAGPGPEFRFVRQEYRVPMPSFLLTVF